jgi:hypothetical protein
MLKVHQELDALGDDVVGFLPLDMRDKADAAGVVFVPGIIQPFGAG